MHDNYGRLFEPAVIDGDARTRTTSRRRSTSRSAVRPHCTSPRPTSAQKAAVSFPDETTIAPVRVRVVVRDTVRVGRARHVARDRRTSRPRPSSRPPRRPASPPAAGTTARSHPPGRADASRRRARLRPDGGGRARRRHRAHDQQRLPLRRRAGRPLEPPSGPEVGRAPGTSLHRNGTELDLGPPAAYGWLAANAPRFHFIQRYAWEPWHFGYTLGRRRGRARARAGGAPTRRRAARSGPAAAACRARRRRSVRPRRRRASAGGDGEAGVSPARSPASFPRASRRSCATPRSAGTCPRSCSPPSSTRSPASTRSRSPGGRARHRAVHAGDGAGDRAREPVRPRGRRSTPRPI